jgi:hypothetical protein
MKPSNISQLKINLNDYLSGIKQIKFEDYDEKTKSSVYLDYKELYTIYSSLTEEQIEENFSTNEIKAINYLGLGLKSENQFNQIILQFQKNADTSAINIVNFIKSRNGFDLINKDIDFKRFTDEELVEIFGGLFGVQIAKDCVKSLRAEKIGRVVGYALSGLFNQDLPAFNDLKDKTPSIDFCSFLKEKIQNSDVECSYIFNENCNDLELACNINEHKNANITEVRGRNRIDHCFVNHANKTITFGQSTSNKDTETQKYTYFKAYATLEKLSSLSTIDGQHNPYFGYALQPYLMLGGRFVADDSITQEKGRGFKKMLKNASQEDLEKLGQMQYFRLFGNSVSSEQVNALTKFNVFIAGCDTLNLYEFSEKINSITNESDKNKACFFMVSSYLNDVCNILSDNDLSFSSGGKIDLSLFLTDIHSISKQLFSNFNFKLNEGEYAEFISPIAVSMNALIDKIKPIAGQFGSQALNDLIDVSEKFETIQAYNRKIENTICANINKTTWKNKALPDMPSDADLSFVIKTAKEIEKKLGLQGRNIFNSFSESLENKIIYSLSSGASSTSALQQTIRSYGYQAFSQFIEKSSFILDGSLSAENMNKKIGDLVDFMKNTLNKQYPELGVCLAKEKINRNPQRNLF